MQQRIFVTGIDTNAGKTLVSAILVEALKADYWKPIQAGEADNTDTMKVAALVSNKVSVLHPEAYKLQEPMSPHIAAEKEGITIDIDSIKLPQTNNHLIIEGAGGLLVPISGTALIIDLIMKLDVEVVLVSRNYLGSINHTLLSAMALKANNIKVKGIIFNGNPVDGTEAMILSHTGYKLLGRIRDEEAIDKTTILRYAEQFSNSLQND
jgi:dethiobiotin synthetase